MSDLFDVSGKTALVTGGSRGIGLMIARGLVQAGARVIVSSRKADDVAGRGRGAHRARRLRGDPRRRLDTARARSALARRDPRALRGARHPRQQRGRRPGARRSRSSRRAAGRRSCTRTCEGVFHLTVALLPRAARRGERRGSRARDQHRLDRRAAHADRSRTTATARARRRCTCSPATSPSAWRPSRSPSTRSRPDRSRAR